MLGKLDFLETNQKLFITTLSPDQITQLQLTACAGRNRGRLHRTMSTRVWHSTGKRMFLVAGFYIQTARC